MHEAHCSAVIIMSIWKDKLLVRCMYNLCMSTALVFKHCFMQRGQHLCKSSLLMPSTASPVWYSESLRDLAQMVLVFIHVSQENQVGTFNWSIFFFLASLLLGQKLCIWKDLAKTACCEALRLSQTVIKSWGKATAPTAGQMEKSSLLS